MGRAIFAGIVGIVAAVIVIMALEFAGHALFPPPEGIDPSDPKAMRDIIDKLPVGSKVAVLVAWFAGTLAGCVAAFRMSSSPWPPRVVVAFIIGGETWSFLNIPHPLWMEAGGLVLPVVAWWLAYRLTARAAS